MARLGFVAVYRNFRLHNGLVLVVRNERGEEERLDTIRSIVERNGRFKIYSTRDRAFPAGGGIAGAPAAIQCPGSGLFRQRCQFRQESVTPPR